MWSDTQLMQLFGIDVPIIQAPMAGSSGLDMAVAVSEAGGLGSLACAPLDADGLKDLLARAKAATQKPLNFNFFCHQPPRPDDDTDLAWINKMSSYFDEVGAARPEVLSNSGLEPFDEARCAAVEASPPAVVSFHFGLPSQDLVRRIKATGAKLISSATTVAEAEYLAGHGCDAVIAQGLEAGGHRGMFLTKDPLTQLGGMSLIPQVADAVEVPVIAAGGIADGRGVVASLALGACAVQVGTAFLFAEEATISEVYKDRLLDARSSHSALSNAFSGRFTRCLVNRLMLENGPVATDAPAFPKGFAISGPLRSKAEQSGSADFSAHYSGQSAALGATTNVADLMQKLVGDTEAQLQRLATGLSR
jgi:nitronate monooxygenase